MRRILLLGLAAFVAAACQPQAGETEDQSAASAGPEPGTVEWKLANALSAAPAEISEAATVMDWPAEPDGEMTELRAGTNGWTCMPDLPSSPGNDPMCLDATFLNWAGAWMSRTTPEIEKTGFGYMLQGGADASNTDPYATEPEPGEDWVKVGPHVMIVVPDPSALEGVPTDPDYGGPFVMWKGTPYAHVMLPVASN